MVSGESSKIVRDICYFAKYVKRDVPGCVQHILVPDAPLIEQPMSCFEEHIVTQSGILRWKGDDRKDIRGSELIVDAGEPLDRAAKHGHPQWRGRGAGLLSAT